MEYTARRDDSPRLLSLTMQVPLSTLCDDVDGFPAPDEDAEP